MPPRSPAAPSPPAIRARVRQDTRQDTRPDTRPAPDRLRCEITREGALTRMPSI